MIKIISIRKREGVIEEAIEEVIVEFVVGVIVY